jgi:photosystem II stability/assembly factor-like uncharacterized protein
MKKCISILFLIILLSNVMIAQWKHCDGLIEYTELAKVLSFDANGKNIFAGMDGKGIYVSTDNGNNWIAQNTGLTNLNINAIATSGNNIFVGTEGGGVFLSTNNGISWIVQNTGLTNLIIKAIATSGNNIFVGTEGGGIFLSTNNGNSWSSKNTGLTNLYVKTIAINGANIFVGAYGPYKSGEGYISGGVFLSKNNGNNWTNTTKGINFVYPITIAINGNTIFYGTKVGIFWSSNNGNSWCEEFSRYLDANSITAIATSGNNIFVGTENWGDSYGTFLSTNNGKRWSLIDAGINSLSITSFAMNGNYIFACDYYGSVWRAKLSDFLTDVEDIHPTSNSYINISPNPATDNITISFSNSELSNTSISIVNYLGIEMKRFDNKELTGKNSINISTESFPSGVYYCTFNSGMNRITKSFVVVK